MSASRMPVFSPIAAKPSARLQEVVDLPTPPLPEATAMTCLTPGMPAAFDVARAWRGWLRTRRSPHDPERVAFLGIAGAQIILGGHHRRALRRPVRVKTLVHHGLDAAIRAHLDDIDALGIGALEHPVLLAKFCQHAVDRALGAERFAAGDAKERLFLLQHPQWRVPCLEIEPRLQRDDMLGTGVLAQPALHAQAFGKAQHGAVGIVRECRRSGRR